MRTAMLAACLFLTPLTSASAPKLNYVPDEKTAVAIGEAVLKPIYGENKIIEEEPFHATLKDGAWTVFGTLTCPDGKGGKSTVCDGGVAEVGLSKEDGRILYVTHGK